MSEGRFLCSVTEIPEAGARGFQTQWAGFEFLFAVKRGSVLRVYRDRCPHQGVPMAWRRDAYLKHDGSRIVCWAHGAEFDIESGLCTLGPCLGQRLQRLEHRVDPDGSVRVLV